MKGQTPSTRARERWGRPLKLAALVIYTLLFGELFVRTFSPQAIMPRYVTGTPWGVRGNIPGSRYWHHTPETDVQYRMNRQGMRADRDFTEVKPPNVCRVALFGDSFFVGYELDLQNTLATLLERKLRASGDRVEVLNFAVSGFGTAEMLRTYESFGSRFDPDVVVYEWHRTDIDDNVRSGLYRLDGQALERNRKSYEPGVEIQDALMSFAPYRFVADESHLYAAAREEIALFIKRLLVTIRRDTDSEDHDATPDATTPEPSNASHSDSSSGTRLSAALLQRAHEEAISAGRDFVLVDIPVRDSRTRFHSAIESLPPRALERLHVISPLSDFRRIADDDIKLYFEHGQGHLTELGSRILAGEAADAIRPLLDDRSCAADRIS